MNRKGHSTIEGPALILLALIIGPGPFLGLPQWSIQVWWVFCVIVPLTVVFRGIRSFFK